jgi:chromosome segregation ATPase
MAVDNNQSEDVDLDRTDRLPLVPGTLADDDVEDDAVRLEHTASLPSIKSEFRRPVGVDLPSLAESVRSVEERIARQNAEYESLSRAHDKARDAEALAVERSRALTAELQSLRATLAAEQKRSADTERALAERSSAAESTRVRIEAALRDVEHYQAESRTLRDTLAARDATIVQALHSLGERDAQLLALQRDYSQIVPALEERSNTGTQLEAELRAARSRSQALAAELKSAQQSATSLETREKMNALELGSTRRALADSKTQAAIYLEQLRTREWRRGFDHNLFRQLDAEIGAAQQGRGALQTESHRLLQRASELEIKLAARDESIAKLVAAVADHEAQRSKHELELQNIDGARAALLGRIAALESETSRLDAELAAKDVALAEALAAGTQEAARGRQVLSVAEKARDDLAAQVEQLQADARTRDEELTVLMAHLQDARRPVQSIEADIKRLTDELGAKTLTLEALTEENRNLRLSIERTRGALEEREFLIRRLERSESNNANVLGRIQTSIERLGASGTPVIASGAAQLVECSAELARVDGTHNTVHPLARRTRIGRAPGCELQIDSSSVSRQHALVVMGQRDVIIEDLNSTNGVLVNGRKISRQLLNDGDTVTIGEAQFRFKLSLVPRAGEAPAPA